MSIKQFLLTLATSLFVSYALVVVFLMFGPVYVDDDLAIKQSGLWTLALAVVVFWPTLILVRRWAARKKRPSP